MFRAIVNWIKQAAYNTAAKEMHSEMKAAKAQATAESVTKVPEAKAVKKGALH